MKTITALLESVQTIGKRVMRDEDKAKEGALVVKRSIRMVDRKGEDREKGVLKQVDQGVKGMQEKVNKALEQSQKEMKEL